ncbi:hypothetical protein Tco_1544057 [Tanacetum coccineum]
MENIDAFSIKDLWGNLNFDYVVGSSVGFSDGIICVWDPSEFIQEHVSKSDYFVAIMGTWSPSSTKLLVISVYAPQELREKRDLWNYLRSFIDSFPSQLSTAQIEDLERIVSYDEVKRAVWDCGANKSPGQMDLLLSSFVNSGGSLIKTCFRQFLNFSRMVTYLGDATLYL